MQMTPFPLETERLILREFMPGDAEAIHAYASDLEVVRFLPFGPNQPQDTEAFLARVIGCQSDCPRFGYEVAVVEKASGHLVGACGLNIDPSGMFAASLGYCYRRSAWGRGFATEAAEAMVKFGFEQLHLHRIYATCDPQNSRSAHVLEKVGMKKEGLKRDCLRKDGRYLDRLLFAVLEQDREIIKY